jgi:hypothetical protein
MEYGRTSPNSPVYASAARDPVCLDHSATLHSHAVAPTRYMQFKIVNKILTKM